MLELALNNEILMSVMIVAVSFIGGRMFKGGSGAGREDAAEVAKALRSYGLDEIPTLLEAYAMRDVKGLVKQIRHLRVIAGNKELLKSELAEVAERLLQEKIDNPLLRAALESRIAAAKAVDDAPTK